MINNHRVKLVGRAVSDTETLDYFTRLIDRGAFEQRTTSIVGDEHGRRTRTGGDIYREVAPAKVLRQ